MITIKELSTCHMNTHYAPHISIELDEKLHRLHGPSGSRHVQLCPTILHPVHLETTEHNSTMLGPAPLGVYGKVCLT